jgi:hypothetical protein
MELHGKEQQMLQECQEEAGSWKGWRWAFLGFGVFAEALGALFLLIHFIPGTKACVGELMLSVGAVWIVTGFYLLDAGIRERRERKLRKLLLKLVAVQSAEN